jgi:hypothetical protein
MGQEKIFKVNQLPHPDLVRSEKVIYYNPTTREIIYKTPKGVKKFASIVPPDSVDAFSINGYYPLYANEALAELNSPLETAVQYGESTLGPAPTGIDYPVYMPLGLTNFNAGDYIDPTADDNNDGVLNFRDAQNIGLAALPYLNYYRQDPFTTPVGTTFSVLDYLSKPDVGTFNNTQFPVAVCVDHPSIIVDEFGEVSHAFGPSACTIPVNGSLFQDVHQNSTVLPPTSSPYTGDPYVTPGSIDVNIEEYLTSPGESFINTTGTQLSLAVIFSGIIVSQDGTVVYFLPGTISIPPNGTVFFNSSSTDSPFIISSDPFVNGVFNFNGCTVNVGSSLTAPYDNGSYNNTGSSFDIQVFTNSILINLSDCSTTAFSPGTITVPNEHVLIAEVPKVVQRWKICIAGKAISVQWFEEDSDGNLVLRESAFDSTAPAVQYWEYDGDDLIPRDFPYSSTGESAQYFEEDSSGDVTLVDS